jgi:hypothetical protein
MYRRILIAATLASTLLAGSAAACDRGGMMHSSGKMQQGMEQHGKGHQGKGKMHFVRKVIAAVSKTGIDSAQAKKVTDAINTFKQAKMVAGQKRVPPLDAFKGDAFDKKAFRKIMLSRPEAMIAAKSDLFESIYAILDKEQRRIFKREFTAHMIEWTIKQDMVKGHMLKGQGRGCGGKSCGK